MPIARADDAALARAACRSRGRRRTRRRAPAVTRNTPPTLPTSSPSTTTRSSRRISTRSASLIAWTMFICGTWGLLTLEALGLRLEMRAASRRRRRGRSSTERAGPRALGARDREVELRAHVADRRLFGRRIEQPLALEAPCGGAPADPLRRESSTRPPRIGVGEIVAERPRRRLDEGGSPALRRPRERSANDREARQGRRRRRRARSRRRTRRPCRPLPPRGRRSTHRRFEHAGEVQRVVEVARVGRAVPEERDRGDVVLLHFGRPGGIRPPAAGARRGRRSPGRRGTPAPADGRAASGRAPDLRRCRMRDARTPRGQPGTSAAPHSRRPGNTQSASRTARVAPTTAAS